MVWQYLQQLVAEKKWGFTRVYTTQEAKEKYGTYGPFSFILATDGKTSVSDANQSEKMFVPTTTVAETNCTYSVM